MTQTMKCTNEKVFLSEMDYAGISWKDRHDSTSLDQRQYLLASGFFDGSRIAAYVKYRVSATVSTIC